MILKALAEVLSVEERFETVRGYKDAAGQTVLEKRSLGWYVRITESSAIRVSGVKPDLKPGDELIVTLEKVLSP